METSENENIQDLVWFAKSMKNKVEEEITDKVETLGAIKTSFCLEVNFRRELGQNEQGDIEIDRQRHYFKEDPRVIDKAEDRSRLKWLH